MRLDPRNTRMAAVFMAVVVLAAILRETVMK